MHGLDYHNFSFNGTEYYMTPKAQYKTRTFTLGQGWSKGKIISREEYQQAWEDLLKMFGIEVN